MSLVRHVTYTAEGERREAGFRAMLKRKTVEEHYMDEPRNVPFGEMGWTDDAPGIRARGAHRGRNTARKPTRLFPIDD